MLDWVRRALETDEVGRTAELGRARVLVARPRPSPGRARKRVYELFEPEGFRLGERLEAPAGAEPGKGDVEAAMVAVRRVLRRVETRPLPSSIQATALRDFAVSPGLYLRRHVLMSDEPEGSRGSAGSAEFGLAVHRALELADYSASASESAAEAEATRLVAACLRAPEFGPKDRERAAGQMRRFLTSPRARLIHSARWVGREIPVAVAIGPTTVHGVADLVWLARDGSAGVLDFKTDDATPERTIERMASEYRTQLMAYALAAVLALGASEISAELAFLSAGELVRLDGSPGGLRAMEEELAGVLRRLGEWEYAREAAGA
jgi:RecB family exonuclease